MEDVMLVNSVPFLVTLSRKTRLWTAEHIPNCSVASLGSSPKKVIQMYGRGGFVVNMIKADQEFEKLEESLGKLVQFNTAAAREHVGEIERSNRTKYPEEGQSGQLRLPIRIFAKTGGCPPSLLCD